SIISIGALFGGSLYDSLVLAPNFRVGLPQSLEHLRQFMAVANPGSFFRFIAPLTQLSILISLILGWRRPAGRRWWLVVALVLIVAGDVVTFTFHYPRNAILFGDPMHTPPEVLEKAAIEWANGNYLRILLVGAAMVSALKALLIDRRAHDA
ncbi:MAG: anthrone oxygenase family protein, partial [Pyrinomonadaceae bacterium]